MTHKQHFLLLSLFFIIFTPLFFLSDVQSPSVSAQSTEKTIYGWAWSDNIGWISFNSKNCDIDGNDKLDPDCGGKNTETLTPYSVKRKNNQIYGYAWSANSGMTGTVMGGGIYFGPDPEGSSVNRTATPGKLWAYMDGNDMKGWARFCTDLADCESGAVNTLNPTKNGGWDGWISLEGYADKGVKFNPSTTNTINGTGCDNSKIYKVSPQSYYGCAWAGAMTPASSNPNEQFPGWIDFNYVLDSTIIGGGHCANKIKDADETGVDCGGTDCKSCGGGGGGHCANGVMDADETGVDCGGTDCKSCGGGTDKCPDGSDYPNSSGVTQQESVACPLYINDCRLILGSDIIPPQSNIKTGSYKWEVIASGGSTNATYNIVWKENGIIVCPAGLPTCTRNYPTTGQTIDMQVSINTNDNTGVIKTDDCNSAYKVVNDIATAPDLIFYNSINSPNIEAYAQFSTPLTAPVYDKSNLGQNLQIKAGQTNSLCSGNISLSLLSIQKNVSGSWQDVPNAGNINYTNATFSPVSSLIQNAPTFTMNGLSLKNKNIWPSSSQYRIKLKATMATAATPPATCSGFSKEIYVPLQLRSTSGEYIEQ